MAHYDDVEFPEEVSLGAVSEAVYSTEVLMKAAGDEFRFGRWKSCLMQYDVSWGIRTMDQLALVRRLFRAMNGRQHSFLFKDPIDHNSKVPTDPQTRRLSPDITSADCPVFPGDMESQKVQLAKGYSAGDQVGYRPIYKPDPDSVVLRIRRDDGFDYGDKGIYYPGTYSVDENGLITLGSRVTKTVNAASIGATGGDADGHFVCGLYASADVFNSETPNGFKDLFVPGDAIIIPAGTFNHGPYNFSVDEPMIVRGFSFDGRQLNLRSFRTSFVGSGPQSSNGTVTVSSAPFISSAAFADAPAYPPTPGHVLWGGFTYKVPVRFDVDRLPTTLENRGYGTISNIRLREVRDFYHADTG